MALEEAKIDKEELDEIVIVGGSSKTPYVRKWLKEFFEVDHLSETVNADEGVAQGAAMMAGQLADQIRTE